MHLVIVKLRGKGVHFELNMGWSRQYLHNSIESLSGVVMLPTILQYFFYTSSLIYITRSLKNRWRQAYLFHQVRESRPYSCEKLFCTSSMYLYSAIMQVVHSFVINHGTTRTKYSPIIDFTMFHRRRTYFHNTPAATCQQKSYVTPE